MAPVAVFALVLALRAASLASLLATPLASWHLWMETDEHAYVEWSARLAAGNWADVPAFRAYFNWQKDYGPPETWEGWYQKNAYYAGPLYPYGLAVLRVAFGSPFLPARLLQLLLACVASAFLAAAVRRVAEDFLRMSQRGEAAGDRVPLRFASWAGVVAGLLYGAYGPLVFHDFFLYRDGPVAHVSTMLLAWPLVAREGSEEDEKISSNGEEGRAARGRWMRGARGAFLLGILGGLAILLKQTTAPLALASLFALSRLSSPFSPSKKSPGGGEGRRSSSPVLFGFIGLALPLGVLAARNISAGVPPLTFDTRQAIGLAWGNGFGADATTNPPPVMGEILVEASGSTSKTAKLVLEGYREAPLQLAKLFLKKLATFINVYEVPDNANFYFFRDRLKILGMLPVFSCLVGAGLVGLFAAWRRGVLRREEGLLALVAMLTPLAACLLVQTTSRYRAATAGSLLPSVIPTGKHRFSDTLVYATIVEAQEGPAAAAAEVRWYLEEGGDDQHRPAGIRALRYWAESGDRSGSLVEPSGIAPPERRVRKKGN